MILSCVQWKRKDIEFSMNYLELWETEDIGSNILTVGGFDQCWRCVGAANGDITLATLALGSDDIFSSTSLILVLFRNHKDSPFWPPKHIRGVFPAVWIWDPEIVNSWEHWVTIFDSNLLLVCVSALFVMLSSTTTTIVLIVGFCTKIWKLSHCLPVGRCPCCSISNQAVHCRFIRTKVCYLK